MDFIFNEPADFRLPTFPYHNVEPLLRRPSPPSFYFSHGIIDAVAMQLE
jgi:hypothetical protein